MIPYIWFNALQEFLIADCCMVPVQIFTTLTILSNFSVQLPTTDKSTAGQMTEAAGVLFLWTYRPCYPPAVLISLDGKHFGWH